MPLRNFRNKTWVQLMLMLVVLSCCTPMQATNRFSEENLPNSTEAWRSQPKVALENMNKISGKTFDSGLSLIDESGIIYEDCIFRGSVKLSDCSSIHFKNCRFDLKGAINQSFVQMYYTDDIVLNNNTFENAYYDNFRHYATIYGSPLIYNKETLWKENTILTDITYNTKWVNAFYIHHGGDVSFSQTSLKEVWVVRESSLAKYTSSLSEKMKVGLREVNWKTIAPYVFRFEGNTRLIQGKVTGAKAFEGLSYAPGSSYQSHGQKIPEDLDNVWDDAAKRIGRFRRSIFLCDMICREGFSSPGKRVNPSDLFKGKDTIPNNIQKILLTAKMSLVSEKRLKKHEVPVERLAFKESEIEALKKHFKGSWHCAFRLLYLCEKFQRTDPGRRSAIKKAIQIYATALLHGMHPPRSISYSNGPKHAGWNHSLFYAERKKGKGKDKTEQVYIETEGAAYQGKPLLSCTSICLWALNRARQCGAYIDQNLFSLAMLSFRNSISKYSVSFPFFPEEKDQKILDNMDRIYLMDSFWKQSKGISVSSCNKPFFDSEMLPRNGMVYLAMTSMGMDEYDGDLENLQKLLRATSGCASAAHGAPSYGMWIYAMSLARMGKEATEALWAQHANLYQHHLKKSWIQFMPVADTKAESDVPPRVFSTLKIDDGSRKQLLPPWKKLSDSINGMKQFRQQERTFYNSKESQKKTYESPMAGYAKTLVKRYDRFKKYCDDRAAGDSVTLDSRDPYYGLYIAVQSAKSLTNYSHASTEFISASVALRKSRPWVVCMPGTGGYGIPAILKAELALGDNSIDEKSKKQISELLESLEKEDTLLKKESLHTKLLALLSSVAKKVQRGKKEIHQLFLPELAWRTQQTEEGQSLFMTLAGDSLLSTKFSVKTDTGEVVIKSARVTPSQPLFYNLALPLSCKELIVDWSFGQTKLSERLQIVEGKDSHLRQVKPVIN